MLTPLPLCVPVQMLCTIIHGVGLLMYLNFEKNKKAPRVDYAPVAAVEDYSL